MTTSGIKSALLIALFVICSDVFGQVKSSAGQSSFVIECNVSGQFLTVGDASPIEKIPNQKITVSFDFFPPEISIDIQGRDRLNVGSVRGKPIILTDENILLMTTVKSPFDESLRSVSIDRVTGFIDVLINVSNPRTIKSTDFKGFCQKASNKKKF